MKNIFALIIAAFLLPLYASAASAVPAGTQVFTYDGTEGHDIVYRIPAWRG